jgi:hypothetical protein
MKTYEITFGSGLAWPFVETIEVEDFENEQDAISKLIDMYENDRNEGVFITEEELPAYNPDEYTFGGNSGLYLLHYGHLMPRLISDTALTA